MKKTMSISTNLFLSKTVLGILWVTLAVLNCLDGAIWNVCSIIILAMVIVISIVTLKVQTYNSDEMSDYNYKEARAIVSEIMHMIYMVLTVATPFIFTKLDTSEWNWPVILGNIFYLLAGIQNLLVGLYFRKLEAE